MPTSISGSKLRVTSPVGYSNKGGSIFNLLRDDLGKRSDITGMNYEVSYSRGIPDGEYTVNVHLYRNKARITPIPITVVTSIKKTPSSTTRQLLASKIELFARGPGTHRLPVQAGKQRQSGAGQRA